MAAIAVPFAGDGRHLNRVQGVRLQPGDVALERVGHVESQRFVEQSVSLDTSIAYTLKYGLLPQWRVYVWGIWKCLTGGVKKKNGEISSGVVRVTAPCCWSVFRTV